MASILGVDVPLVNKAEGARPEFPVPAMTNVLESTFDDYRFDYDAYALANNREHYLTSHMEEGNREEFMGTCSDTVINHMIRVARVIVDAGHSEKVIGLKLERNFFDEADSLILGLTLGRSNQEITMRTTVSNGRTKGTIEIGDISLAAEIDAEGNWNSTDGIKLKDYTLIAGSDADDTTPRPRQMEFMHNDLTDIARLDCVLQTIEGALGQIIEP